MRIAIVSDAIYPYNKGGKEKRIYELSSRLIKLGHEVDVYSMKWWTGKNQIKQNGVTLNAISKLYPLYKDDKRSISQAILFSIACLKLIKKDFDILDADHMPHLILFPIRIVCFLKRRKMVVTWNEVWGREYWVSYMGFLGNAAAFIEKLSARLPDCVISISKHTTQKFKKDLNSNKQIITIPLGINFREIEKIKPSKNKSDVIFAGRLLKNKNVDLLIRSIRIISKKDPKIKCIIVGEGPEKNNLINLSLKLNLGKNIIFLDFLPNHNDLYSLFKSSKVFVLPSDREGFGITVLEANACGIPAITTNHKNNAAKDLIGKANGKIIKTDEKEIASAIGRLIKDGRKMSKDCVSFARQFDWNNIASLTIDAYGVKKEAVVTTSWDDGHRLDLKLASMLRKHNIAGTFYVNQKNREYSKKDSLSEAAIKRISKNFEIGAHTTTHPHLTEINLKEAELEILSSKKYLEKVTSKKITAFCYPYGEYNSHVKSAVKKSGFKLARTVARFQTNIENDRFELPTTVHAYSHFQDLKSLKIFKYRTADWEVLAKKQFDQVERNGGTFHLWGHSWEIEKHNDWEKLERVLEYIGNRKDFKYVTNSSLIK